MATEIIKDLRIIEVTGALEEKKSRIKKDSMPYECSIVLEKPELALFDYRTFYGDSEKIIVSANTLEEIEAYIKKNNFRNKNRFVSISIKCPDGTVIEENKE